MIRHEYDPDEWERLRTEPLVGFELPVDGDED